MVASLSLASAVTTLPALVPVGDRCLPVADALARLLPEAGLQRGRVVGCSGAAAWSLAFGLISCAVAGGAWVAMVGTPSVGLEAAAELDVALARVVLVGVDGGAAVWAERVAAAADGFELIVTCPPAGAERVARRVRQRLQSRGVVLVAVSTLSHHLGCDLELATTSVAWAGIGQGTGHLLARRVTVEVGGRRVPRPTSGDLLLPDPNGHMRALPESGEHRLLEWAG